MFIIVITSTLLQFAAGFLALRLVAASGRNRAWLLLAAGIFAMAFRRLHSLIGLYRSGRLPSLDYELLGLAISVLIFAGIYHIAPLLRGMRQSAAKVAESEERYRTAAMFTYGWEYWLTPEGRYVYVSPACERISGYPPEAFLDDPRLFHSLIHPADRDDVLDRLSSMNNLRRPLHFDCRIVNADGDTRWIDFHSVPVYGENGVFLGVRASIRDIDRRKHLEEELIESRALYRGLVENALSMVLRLDRDGVITFANRYAVEQLSGGRDDLSGKSLAQILTARGCEKRADTAFAPLLEKGERLETELALRKPDGSTVWIEWTGSALPDEHGRIKGYICMGIDVTRRKALDKLREDMIRVARHDLKSPLTGIIGIPRVLARDENLTPRQREMLKAVEEAGDIMLEKLNRSLDLYKLETGTYEFHLETFDLLELLRELTRQFLPNEKEDGKVRLTLNGSTPAPADTAPIRAERPLIHALFGNLLDNALAASEDRPVLVDVTSNGKWRVSLRNAGVVPKEIRDTFFNKYVTMGKPGGTGLGAYSARLIARRHGGDITMRSSESEGTALAVTLPRQA